MKLRTLGLIGLFVLLFTGCSSNPSAEEINAQLEEGFNQVEKTFPEKTIPENANIKINLGKTFEAEGFLNVANYYLDHWVNPGDDFGFETPDAGNKFIAMNVTVTNNNPEEAETNSGYYTLDFGGTDNAEHSYFGTTAPNITHFETTKLAPGESYTADFLFEVPEGSTPTDWTLVYNSNPFSLKENYTPTRVALQ